MKSNAALVLVLALCTTACGEFAPTATFVSAHHDAVVIEVVAPPGTQVDADGVEAVVDETGRARIEIAMTHYSETAGNPEISVFFDEDAIAFARDAYLQIELPLRLEIIQNLPTEEQGFVFLPETPGAGTRVATLPGASLEVDGQPVQVDAFGIGYPSGDFQRVVLASPVSLLAGGTVSVPGTITIGGSTRSVEAPLAMSAARIAGQLDAWLDGSLGADRLSSEQPGTLLWRRMRQPLEPTYVLLGSPATLGTRFVATETLTSTELRRCPGGAPLVRDDREVVVRDALTGAEVARHTFGPGRIQCPAVFDLATPSWHYASPHAPIQEWLEGEVARLSTPSS